MVPLSRLEAWCWKTGKPDNRVLFFFFFLSAPEDHLSGRAFSVITNFFFTHYASVFRINRTVVFRHSLKVAM